MQASIFMIAISRYKEDSDDLYKISKGTLFKNV